MKIENKNKKRMYDKFLVRSGIAISKHVTKQIPEAAIWQMKHKPYVKGGSDVKEG